MLGVKITIVLIVITFLYGFYVRAYISNMSKQDLSEMVLFKKYPPCIYIRGCMLIFSGIGIVYSVIYLLFFFRW